MAFFKDPFFKQSHCEILEVKTSSYMTLRDIIHLITLSLNQRQGKKKCISGKLKISKKINFCLLKGNKEQLSLCINRLSLLMFLWDPHRPRTLKYKVL